MYLYLLKLWHLRYTESKKKISVHLENTRIKLTSLEWHLVPKTVASISTKLCPVLITNLTSKRQSVSIKTSQWTTRWVIHFTIKGIEVILPNEVSSQNTSLCLTDGFILKRIFSLSKTSSKFLGLIALMKPNFSMKIVKTLSATYQDKKVRSPFSTSNHSCNLRKTRSDTISSNLTQWLCSLSNRRHPKLYPTGSKEMILAISALRLSKKLKNSSRSQEIRSTM